MKSSVIRSALLIVALSASFVTGQDEPVRLNVRPEPSTIRFRIVDPIAIRTQEATAKAATLTGDRQLIAAPSVDWAAPENPATMKMPAVPRPRITARRPSVSQADHNVQAQRKLVPQIRLVQAEDVDDSFLDDLRSAATGAGSEDIDELLDQAQKLIEEERLKSNNDRLSPSQIRSRMERELDSLLPGEGEEDRDPDLLADSDEDGEGEDDFSYLKDPEPRPIYERRQRRQVPYTMGDIFSDEDEVDPVCEQMFCERMWACAGGKCMSALDRAKRNFRRDYALFHSPCGTPICRPMENFQCPPRSRQNVNGNYASHAPMLRSEMGCPPSEGVIQELPAESYPDLQYPTENVPGELAPVALPSTSPAAAATETINALTPDSAADNLLRSIE